MPDPRRSSARLSWSRRACGLLFTFAAAGLLGACAAPYQDSKARLEDRAEARKEARGAWAELHFTLRGPSHDVTGELLAAASDSIYIMTREGLVAVPTKDLMGCDLTLYEAPSEPVDHARVLVLHTRAVTSWHGGTGVVRWETLTQYCRFPQGLPAGFDRSTAAAP